MTKHDIRDYIGVLIMGAIVIFGMLYVQRHVDSLASRYNQEERRRIDFTPVKSDFRLLKKGK